MVAFAGRARGAASVERNRLFIMSLDRRKKLEREAAALREQDQATANQRERTGRPRC